MMEIFVEKHNAFIKDGKPDEDAVAVEGYYQFRIASVHYQTEEKAREMLEQLLQGQRLLKLLQNTTIDMTTRERSLLDLLLQQSKETEKDKSVPAYGDNIGT